MQNVKKKISQIRKLYVDKPKFMVYPNLVNTRKEGADMTRITLRAARVNAGLTLKEVILLRYYKGKTQTEVAKKLGVTERTVGNWEKGSTSIPAKELIALCTIYAISIAITCTISLTTTVTT